MFLFINVYGGFNLVLFNLNLFWFIIFLEFYLKMCLVLYFLLVLNILLKYWVFNYIL